MAFETPHSATEQNRFVWGCEPDMNWHERAWAAVRARAIARARAGQSAGEGVLGG